MVALIPMRNSPGSPLATSLTLLFSFSLSPVLHFPLSPSRHFLQSPLLSVSPTLFFTNSPPHRFSPSHLLPISVSPTHPLSISPSPIQFSILFSIFVPSQTVLSRFFRGMRKVRATKGAMLPNGKAGVSLQ